MEKVWSQLLVVLFQAGQIEHSNFKQEESENGPMPCC